MGPGLVSLEYSLPRKRRQCASYQCVPRLLTKMGLCRAIGAKPSVEAFLGHKSMIFKKFVHPPVPQAPPTPSRRRSHSQISCRGIYYIIISYLAGSRKFFNCNVAPNAKLKIKISTAQPKLTRITSGIARGQMGEPVLPQGENGSDETDGDLELNSD